MSNFEDVINDKIVEVQQNKAKLEQLANSPSYHVDRMTSIINDAIKQVEALEEESFDAMKDSFINALSQIPNALAQGWGELSSSIQVIESEERRWSEMREMYTQWAESENKPTPEPITSHAPAWDPETTPEPSTRTGMRRAVGTKPPVTLGNYRRAASYSGGEDSEA